MDVYPVEVFRMDCQEEDEQSEEEILVPDVVSRTLLPTITSTSKDIDNSTEIDKDEVKHTVESDLSIVKHDIEDVLENSEISKDLSSVKKRKQKNTLTKKEGGVKKRRKQSYRTRKKTKRNSSEPSGVIVLSDNDTSLPEEPKINENDDAAFQGTVIHQFDMPPDDYETALAASYLSAGLSPDRNTTANFQEEEESSENNAVEEATYIRGFDLDCCIGSLQVIHEYLKPLDKNKHPPQHKLVSRKGVPTTTEVKNIFYCLRCFDLMEKKDDFMLHECEKFIDSTCPVDYDKCLKCNIRTNCRKDMQDHELLIHGHSITFKCPFCQSKLAREWKLKAHVVKAHAKCGLCNYRSMNRIDRWRHYTTEHSLTEKDISFLKENVCLSEENEKDSANIGNTIKGSFCTWCRRGKKAVIQVKAHSVLHFPNGLLIHYSGGRMTNLLSGVEMFLTEKRKRLCYKKEKPSDVIEIPSSPVSADVIEVISDSDSEREPARRSGRIISLDGDIREEDDILPSEEPEDHVEGNSEQSTEAAGDNAESTIVENLATAIETVPSETSEVSERFTLENGVTVAVVGDRLINVETGEIVNVVSAVMSEEEFSALGLIPSSPLAQDIKEEIDDCTVSEDIKPPCNLIEMAFNDSICESAASDQNDSTPLESS